MSETVISIESIPHRAPFVFVDRIVEVSDRRITTQKLADPGADFFRGHYPNKPIMPGVLLCEACFQAGALLVAHRIGPYQAEGGAPVVTRISDARFKRMVVPGDLLDVEVTLDEELDGAYFMTGRVQVRGQLAVRLGFACMWAHDKGDPA